LLIALRRAGHLSRIVRLQANYLRESKSGQSIHLAILKRARILLNLANEKDVEIVRRRCLFTFRRRLEGDSRELGRQTHDVIATAHSPDGSASAAECRESISAWALSPRPTECISRERRLGNLAPLHVPTGSLETAVQTNAVREGQIGHPSGLASLLALSLA